MFTAAAAPGRNLNFGSLFLYVLLVWMEKLQFALIKSSSSTSDFTLVKAF